jgi:DNA-3-methyladenine glycosylase II
MNWMDQESSITINTPVEFSFKECKLFLGRSEHEVLHQIRDDCLYKLVKMDGELILIKIESTHQSISVEFPIRTPSKCTREKIVHYLWEWFDLNRDLGNFYEMASQDMVLKHLVQKYYGLRIMCIPDLFEALTWAIIGQQINLTFAYTLKKRFVEQFGECLTFEGHTFWVFPEFRKAAKLTLDDLRKLQFTSRKAEYIIGVAKAMTSGQLTKEGLLQVQDYQLVHKSLMAIRGVGAWTADYVMMKCLQHPSAFPIADVGLQNALKLQLGLERKPTIAEIEKMSGNWEGLHAYATFYLWRSLYE